MSRICLVSVFGPQQIIPAIAAVEYYGKISGKESNPRVILLLHNPGLPDTILDECAIIIHKMTKPFGWQYPVILKSQNLHEIIGSGQLIRRLDILNKFRHFIGAERVDEVYFTHNLVGNVTDLCLRAFPNAEWITIGDGFGLLIDNKYLSFINQQIQPSFIGQLVSFLRNVRNLFLFPRHVNFGSKTIVVAILPIDWYGDFLGNKQLFVVHREEVLIIINKCRKQLVNLNRYCERLILSTTDPRYVYVLNNYTDGQFITFISEVAMHEEIIRTLIPKGSTIIIKPHPFSVAPVAEQIQNNIELDYPVQIFSPELNRYPFELCQQLIDNTQVIAFSSINLNLAHLFNKVTINSMNEMVMRKYFPQKIWHLIIDTMTRNSRAQTHLQKWDKKSALLSGMGRQKP